MLLHSDPDHKEQNSVIITEFFQFVLYPDEMTITKFRTTPNQTLHLIVTPEKPITPFQNLSFIAT